MRAASDLVGSIFVAQQMSTRKPTVKCNRCGQDVPSGAGYILNASLSEEFAARLERGVEKKKGSTRKEKLDELRMKQVLACSEKCARRAADDDEEIAIARQAAAAWWYIRGESGDLESPEDVYITRGMINHDLLDASETLGDNSASEIGSIADFASSATIQACRLVFSLGGGFDPDEDGRELVEQFKDEHPQFDFENAEVQTASITPWSEGNHEQLRQSIKSFADGWFATRKLDFDPQRLLHADYYDDDDNRGYAVVAYLDSQDAESASDVAAASASSQAEKWLVWIKEQKLLVGGSVAAIVLLLSVILFWPSGDGGATIPTADSNATKNNTVSRNGSSASDGSDVPLPKVTTGVARIYSAEPGFVVLVDGEPARDINGEMLKTPCAVNVEAGSRAIMLAKDGHRDVSRVVVVSEDTEIFFEADELDSGVSSVLSDPYLDAAVGEPIALESLNSPGNETDPYLTPDGLEIFFAADRREGKGIYQASRASIFAPFSEPSLLSLTRSGDMPATPSVTGDGLFVVYAVPQKARLMALTRENPITDFTEKTPFRFTDRGEPVWQSAQIITSGLRIYWVEENKGKTRTLTSSRAAADKEFQKTTEVDFPGIHPCMSSDGLRQYAFDGQKLRRARRAAVTDKFSTLENVADLKLPNYEPLKSRRQYFVTDDEQWLFYADDPEGDADLHMVRIHPGRGWGVRPRGKKIPNRVKRRKSAVAKADETITFDPAKSDPAESMDPRLLPYSAHWKQLRSLIGNRDYRAAKTIASKSIADPKLKDDRQLIAWDQQDVANVEKFWEDVRKILGTLNPGDEIRIGRIRLEFVSFQNDTLVGKGKTKQVERKLLELDASDLVYLVERLSDGVTEQTQFHIGTFLFYDGDGNARLARTRLTKAGPAGNSFLEQQGMRLLKQAEQEFARDKFSDGTRFVGEVLSSFSGTAAAVEAAELREKLYSFIKWNRRGPRNWKQKDSEFAAGAERAAGSFLQSPEQYQNFELTLEWKTTATNGQGGVFFRYPGEGELYQTAFKIQLSNDRGRAPDVYSSGALFSVAAPDSNAVKPQDEWNTLKLRFKGENVEVIINDKPVLNSEASNDEIPLKGFIAIDGSAGGITYRRILITEI